jgi:circadian clock protein KaiB
MNEGVEANQAADQDDLEEAIAGSVTEAFERALAVRRPDGYVLALYVAGAAPRSLRAIANVRRLCREHLSDCYELQVIDIYQEPALAELDGILAVPVLVKRQPLPARSFIGDMSNFDRVLEGLGLSRSAGAGD